MPLSIDIQQIPFLRLIQIEQGQLLFTEAPLLAGCPVLTAKSYPSKNFRISASTLDASFIKSLYKFSYKRDGH
jgi:hypothetical protein